MTVEPGERSEWLTAVTVDRPDVYRLVEPVLEQFAGQEIGEMEPALDWCREYVISVR